MSIRVFCALCVHLFCKGVLHNKAVVPRFSTYFMKNSVCYRGAVLWNWFFLSFTPQTGANPDCPTGWMQFSSYCYFASTSTQTWQDAQTYCNDLGAELAKITSAEENDFVLALARRDAIAQGRVWIGLEWSSTVEGFLWSDMSTPVYTNWGPNRPDGNASKPCSVMWTNRDPQFPSGYWNDRGCGNTSSWSSGIVCKRLP